MCIRDRSYVDKFIRVTAVSTDGRGGTTSFESSSQLVVNVNDSPVFDSVPILTVNEDSIYEYSLRNLRKVNFHHE